MTSFSVAGGVERSAVAAGNLAERLPADQEEGELMAAAMAIPARLRADFLAHLRAVVGENATVGHSTQT